MIVHEMSGNDSLYDSAKLKAAEKTGRIDALAEPTDFDLTRTNSKLLTGSKTKRLIPGESQNVIPQGLSLQIPFNLPNTSANLTTTRNIVPLHPGNQLSSV
jgi:hypothetical protein